LMRGHFSELGQTFLFPSFPSHSLRN
jgi:hypothetical protein